MSNRRPSIADLPFWPRHLNRELAAAYVGVSTDTFDDKVRHGVWPAGERRGAKGGRITWDRAALDQRSDLRSHLSMNAHVAASRAHVRSNEACQGHAGDGVKIVRMRLADGSVREYRYVRPAPGGGRESARRPGRRSTACGETYLASAQFKTTIEPSTQAFYRRHYRAHPGGLGCARDLRHQTGGYPGH